MGKIPRALRRLPGAVPSLLVELAPDIRAQAEKTELAAWSPPRDRPGSSRNRSRPSPGEYSLSTAACRKCGNMRSRHFVDDWRSSYKPPVSGPRHYRWKTGKRGIYRHAFTAAVVTFLFLIGLPTRVVFVLLAIFVVFSCGLLGRRCGLLELAHPRLDFINEANVLVVLHHAT